jgi:predicted metal-dependent hydrolase
MPLDQRRETVVIDGRSYTYVLRRSRRARHILLTVDGEGEIEVVVPWRASLQTARQFVREKGAWLQRATVRHRRLAGVSLVDGASLPLLGERLRLRVVIERGRQRSRVQLDNNVLMVYVSTPPAARAAVVRWYRRRAAAYFAEAVVVAAARLKVQPGRIVVSAATSQWGSCIPSTGRISLNWRLLLAPRAVANYVVAHEVAHLRERRHTPRFWGTVELIMPGYTTARAWLRKHGGSLRL